MMQTGCGKPDSLRWLVTGICLCMTSSQTQTRLEFVFLYGEDDFYSVNITSGEVYKILEPRGKKELWDMLEKDYYGIECLTLVGNSRST
ncbi:hypothetical protein JVT61DRAFT_7042 [Boletus reticuloceps]|uniref:Uncharacterized protein n=1 Tax=Boletus reticuloceps TaxID=495285 RepID=A0A8I3A814_9AGAM|nr:hypothetical protein JVT61DRAFT_7042 [Boletus reticuloceps]